MNKRIDQDDLCVSLFSVPSPSCNLILLQNGEREMSKKNRRCENNNKSLCLWIEDPRKHFRKWGRLGSTEIPSKSLFHSTSSQITRNMTFTVTYLRSQNSISQSTIFATKLGYDHIAILLPKVSFYLTSKIYDSNVRSMKARNRRRGKPPKVAKTNAIVYSVAVVYIRVTDSNLQIKCYKFS